MEWTTPDVRDVRCRLMKLDYEELRKALPDKVYLVRRVTISVRPRDLSSFKKGSLYSPTESLLEQYATEGVYTDKEIAHKAARFFLRTEPTFVEEVPQLHLMNEAGEPKESTTNFYGQTRYWGLRNTEFFGHRAPVGEYVEVVVVGPSYLVGIISLIW